MVFHNGVIACIYYIPGRIRHPIRTHVRSFAIHEMLPLALIGSNRMGRRALISYIWAAMLTFTQMDQRPYPGPPLLFHIRVYALASLLWITDLAVFLLTLENMYTHGVGGTVLFASEVSEVERSHKDAS